MTTRTLDERGITLTEVTIVAVIGLLVLMGLGGFYLNSQATWLDASSQSITQREATLLTETIADSVRWSRAANASNNPDAEHAMLTLYRYGQVTPSWCYWWNPGDSLVHHGPDPANDRGAMLSSKVERFRVITDVDFVQVAVRLRSATGQTVELSTTTLMRNR